MISVALTPIKQLFINESNGYRVLSCVTDNPEVELNKYGNFTISGNNLYNIPLHQEIKFNLVPDAKSKYSASYVVLGYSGITFDGNIKVDPDDELMLLKQIMSDGQAKNIHDAYPDFIQKVLNGEESEIDVKKIHNVAEYRFQDYCEKIRNNCRGFMFYPYAYKYNITDNNIIAKFSEAYATPDLWEEQYNKYPYKVLSNAATKWSFKHLDKTILSALPDFKESLERATYCVLDILSQSELDGDTRLSAYVLMDIIREDYPELSPFIKKVMEDDRIVYDPVSKDCSLKVTYNAERLIADNILERVNKPFVDNMEWEKFKEVDGYTMTEEQNQICKIANNESIGMLIGPGGTGKSTSTRALIEMLEYYGKTYLLLAPTGIAAKKLAESTRRHASTIHMALARETFSMDVYDYIIIDEMSCVGVHLLAQVFNCIPKTTKVIFVCDAAQLASIACGNIVQDVIDGGKVKIAQLTKVFRYGTSGIATIATNTRKGIDEGRNDTYDAGDYTCIDIDQDSEEALNQITETYGNLLAEGYAKKDILILCPFNKSVLGTYMINDAIQKEFNANIKKISFPLNVKGCPLKELTFKIGDRVINTKNNYNMKLVEEHSDGYWSYGSTSIMNGDIGVVRDIVMGDNNTTSIYVQFDERLVEFSPQDTANLLLGYCISVHKSQGSQAKAIISVIGRNHRKMVTRNLLYVAVSRAQEKLVEIVDEDSVSKGLEVVETVERTTWLKEFLEGG